MRDFLRDSKRILNDIETLNSYTGSIDYLSSQKNSSVLNRKDEEELNNQIDVLNGRFRKLSRAIKERIDVFSEETTKLERENKGDEFYNETRRMHLHAQSKKLTEAINRYREMQVKNREDEVDKFKLQYIIAKPDATEKEIEEFIGDDDGTKVTSAYALGAHSAQGILEEAENRKRNIRKIEEMVQEIVDLLNLINQEVSKRTDVVEAINDDLISGEENTAAANIDLESALTYQIRATMIKRTIVWVALIVIAVFLIYFIFKNNFFGLLDRDRRRSY